MTTVAPTFREPALPEKAANDGGNKKPPMRLGALSASSLLDFPPGLSPSPLPTIEQTPNRFLAACAAKLDQEPNPFETTFKQVASGGPVPEPPSGIGFSLSPKPILPPLTPSPRFMGAFDSSYPFTGKTGLTPGGLLTPFSAAIKSLTSEPLTASETDTVTSGPSPMIPASSEPIPASHIHSHQDPHSHYQFPAPSQPQHPSSSAALTSHAPYPLQHQHSDPGIYPGGGMMHQPHQQMQRGGPMMPHMGYAQGRTASGYPIPIPGGVDPMLTQAPPVPVGAYPPLGTVDDPAAAAAAGLQLLSAAGGKVDIMRRQSLESQKGGWPGMVEEESNGPGSAGDVSPKQGKGKDVGKGSKKRKADTEEAGGDSKAAKLNGSGKKNARTRKKSGEGAKKESKAESKLETKTNGSVNGKGVREKAIEGRGSIDPASEEMRGGSASVSSDDEGYDDEMQDRRDGRAGSMAKSVGDEDPDEKRKSFLERNRQAALKCRQKKKQWLQSLQQKVEFLSTDNENLQNQATQLREEILNLKTLLLAHKDCPVANANGLDLGAIEATLPFPSHGAVHGGPGGPSQGPPMGGPGMQAPHHMSMGGYPVGPMGPGPGGVHGLRGY
ncbi:hypothetical protein HK097_005769 [Rhizophlyctis rosea]|uniref:BZIP domain-containing protein n=1 Tax=Rhizophlyctis rosea TaxID=64517 RepID=A0AAD5X9S2_9FUNG|nr:hypothetical protein HK097_005769 [Rhizophlyctis rosea]